MAMTSKAQIFTTGVALGAAYVLVCYFFLGHFRALPTAAFLGGVPVVLGVVPFLFSDEN